MKPSFPSSRTGALLVAAALASAAWPGPGAAVAAPVAPDLTVRKDGFLMRGDSLRIVVENLGTAASPATVMYRDSDGVFLGGPGRGLCPYRPVSGMAGVWVDQEYLKGGTSLTLHLRAEPGGGRSRGSVRFDTEGVPDIRFDPTRGLTFRPGTESAPALLEWDLDVPDAGEQFTVNCLPPVPAGAVARIEVRPDDRGRTPRLFTSVDEQDGVAELPLLRARFGEPYPAYEIPALEPGERTELWSARQPAGPLAFWVDPHDEIDEIAEGNNVSTWKPDAEWTLAALHVHSSFSEGVGSFDWQNLHAALSGYDLMWWSEHDWRITCRDALETMDFERGGDTQTSFTRDGPGAEAVVLLDGGEDRGAALRLATGSAGGAAEARLTSRRRRQAVPLAADMNVEARLLARTLQPDDLITVTFKLSVHPGEVRRLVYELRWNGSDVETAAGPGWAPRIRRPVATGGWITVKFPLSRDAAAHWPNGLDSNIAEVRVELIAGGAAEVRVDHLEFRREKCGRDLVRVEQEWTERYPNLHHRVGGEVSFGFPHILRYGGDAEALFLDMERQVEDSGVQDVERIVRGIHDAGALASWAHPLGFRWPTSRQGADPADEMIAGRLGGADAVEVGYRRRADKDLSDHLDLWNRACAAGLTATALGVNDSHAYGWTAAESNFATWLRAPADDGRALVRAIAEGQAFFGDPATFQGSVDLTVSGTAMGGTRRAGPPHEAVIRMNSREPVRVMLVADGETVQEFESSGRSTLTRTVGEDGIRSLRVEVWSREGEPLAFTNPVYIAE